MQCPPTLHLHWVSTDPCAQGSMVFNGPHSRISRQASIVLVSPALLQKAQSSFATKMAFTEINWTLQTEIDACRPTLIFCTLEPIQILKAPSMKSSYTAAIIKMTFYIQGPKAILNHEPISERGTPSLWAEWGKWKCSQGLWWISIYLLCEPALHWVADQPPTLVSAVMDEVGHTGTLQPLGGSSFDPGGWESNFPLFRCSSFGNESKTNRWFAEQGRLTGMMFTALEIHLQKLESCFPAAACAWLTWRGAARLSLSMEGYWQCFEFLKDETM